MMKTRETSLWAWLRKFHADDLHMERVENAASSSHPDVDGCKAGGAFKIELKTADRPARETTSIRTKFQPGQSDWLARRWACGGRAWLLIQVGSAHAARRYLIRGSVAFIVEDGVVEYLLRDLSVTPADATAEQIVSTAAEGKVN